MRKQIVLSVIFLISAIVTPIFSQVTVSGGVSIDVNLPIPKEIVIVGETPRRAPTPRPQPQPRPRPIPRNVEVFSYGEIQNQNGPVGRQIYTVTNAQLGDAGNGVEVVSYELDSGDILELFISTANPNDYNYHAYNNHHSSQYNNTIHKVLLNGHYLELRDGSLSLQPKDQYGFHSVINLHSTYEGDFNGTVNF